MSEQWLPVEQAPYCEVSDEGNVRHEHNGHYIYPEPYDKGGKAFVKLPFETELVWLVLTAFAEVPRDLDKYNLVYLDGDHMNCAIDNLGWQRRIYFDQGRMRNHKDPKDS